MTYDGVWPVALITLCALDEAAVDEDRVLAVAPDEGDDNVVAELALARLGAKVDFMGVVKVTGYPNLAVRELWDSIRAEEIQASQPSALAVGRPSLSPHPPP